MARPPHARRMGVIVQSGRCHDVRAPGEPRRLSHVGRAARRREDPPLLRGEGRFLDDLPIDGVAHVAFVRSAHAHARLVALDVAVARKAAGVIAVVTAAEVDAFPAIGMARAIEGMVVPEMAFVAGDVVRCQGTPVAIVVAESAELAHDAAALVRAEWTALPGAAEPDAALAVYVEPSGLGWESGLVRMETDGRVTVATGSSAHGQGHETVFAQIVADRLGIEPEAIDVRHGDTAAIATGIGTFGSRSTALGGGALVHAADAVVVKARRLAAHLLEAHAADVRLGAGGFAVAGVPDRFVRWADVARLAWAGPLPPGEEPGLEASHVLAPEHEVWSGGAVVAAVRIERETGALTLERLVWIDDAGTIVNPLLADGQLDGSLAQAWGQIALEAVRFDADGHLLSGTLMDYALPRADDVPHAEVHHMHSPTPRNRLGAKGLGEAGNIGVPPAVVNAAVDALAPLGVRHLDMPLTPESIWKAMPP